MKKKKSTRSIRYPKESDSLVDESKRSDNEHLGRSKSTKEKKTKELKPLNKNMMPEEKIRNFCDTLDVLPKREIDKITSVSDKPIFKALYSNARGFRRPNLKVALYSAIYCAYLEHLILETNFFNNNNLDNILKNPSIRTHIKFIYEFGSLFLKKKRIYTEEAKKKTENKSYKYEDIWIKQLMNR